MISNRKRLGQYFTPDEVASSLVRWVVRRKTDRILDPSCGDGQFLKHHRHSVGVEICAEAASEARKQAPSALVHGGEFFDGRAPLRSASMELPGILLSFDFNRSKAKLRAEALAAASVMGANFSALTSSWAPFVLVAAGLLKFGGRMAFVVPAEIGHANYARELIPALCGRFREVRVIACREKLFPALSEDCWLLWCDGYGSRCGEVGMSILDRFMPSMEVPAPNRGISLSEWNAMGGRLRPFLLTVEEREIYRDLKNRPTVRAFGDLANASIGYVSGANDFFHLRPSQANSFRIPDRWLRVAVRKASQLPGGPVKRSDVERWLTNDDPVLLLDLNGIDRLPAEIRRYLDTEEGEKARATYKCRNRKPWYAVPDVKVPTAFMTVMNGRRPSLIFNEADCVCTNSLHAVTLRSGVSAPVLRSGWESALAELGTEIEGHPLGGGMLKLEPREAQKIPIPTGPISLTSAEHSALLQATQTMRTWRHYG